MNSQSRAEQLVMRVNARAWRYEANLSTAQNTARHSRSVGDFFSSVFDHRCQGVTDHFLNLGEDCTCSGFTGGSV